MMCKFTNADGQMTAAYAADEPTYASSHGEKSQSVMASGIFSKCSTSSRHARRHASSIARARAARGGCWGVGVEKRTKVTGT